MRLVLSIFRHIDSLDLEHDRAGAVIAADNHYALIVGPAFHDGAAGKSRIDVTAYGIPRLGTGKRRVELTPKVVEVLLPGLALEQVLLTHFEAGERAAFGVRKVLFLELGEKLLIDDRNLALMFHSNLLSKSSQKGTFAHGDKTVPKQYVESTRHS